MTKEEAITREEAIRRIKAWNLDPDDMEVLSAAIPELAESEDERIRKELIDILKKSYEFGGFTLNNKKDLDKYLAYLEKQKEQSFTHHEIDESLWDAVIHQMEDDGDVDDFVRRGIDNIVLKYALLGAKWQKEQKPAVKQLGGTFNSYDMSKTFVDGQYYVMEHPERFGLCKKPAEWSDTDNIGWDEAFACVTRAEKAAKNEEELQNAVTAEKWLKEIKFKYYVHPVKQEWSEEDEDTYNQVYYLFRDARDEWYKAIFSGCYPKITRDKVLAMLKSLHSRPKASDNWKPSEEQVSAFKGYIEDFQARAEAAVGGWNNFDVMIRLYEQLKKLM